MRPQAELYPEPEDYEDPIEAVLHKDPRVRRLRKAVRSLSRRVRKQASADDWATFVDRRTLLRSAELERIFAAGFDSGLVRGRADTLRQRREKAHRPAARRWYRALQRSGMASRLSTDERAIALIELAWALLQRPPPKSLTRGRDGRRA